MLLPIHVRKTLKKQVSKERIFEVVDQLSEGKTLDSKYKDHKLSGEYKGMRECHIEPDFLLIYLIQEKEIVLYLVRVGSHSELFK